MRGASNFIITGTSSHIEQWIRTGDKSALPLYKAKAAVISLFRCKMLQDASASVMMQVTNPCDAV
jgi:hypothetical protein